MLVAVRRTPPLDEHQMVSPFAGQTWVHVALLVWGTNLLRPASKACRAQRLSLGCA